MADHPPASPYVPCTLIMPGGLVARNKSIKAGRLMNVDQALAALGDGKPAWVAPDDEEKVLQGLKGAGMV